MKKRNALILIIVIAWLLIFISAFFAGFNSTATISNPCETDLSDWMNILSDDVLLKSVAIPGSHDSATKGMPWLGETQNLSIKDQLFCGIRYFDIRIKKKGDNYVIFHGPITGISAESVFADLAEFMKSHSTETVILDFQHFDNSEEGVVSFIEKYLSPYVISAVGEKVPFINGVTIGACRGKCLVFWGGENENILAKDYIFPRNDDECTKSGTALQSRYITAYHNANSEKFISEALPDYIQKFIDGGENGLFVLQGQLTDGLRFRGPIFREAQHSGNMSAYVNTLAQSPYLGKINIIMRDYVNSRKSLEIINLNYAKGITKTKIENKTQNFKFCVFSF